MTQELPQKFLGKFKLGKSEHFDEYLAAKGVPWLVRKMIQFQSVTKIFEKSKQEGRYNMQNITSKESPIYENWALGESFEGRGLDGTQHKVKFDMVGDELTEEHFRLEDPNDKGDIGPIHF